MVIQLNCQLEEFETWSTFAQYVRTIIMTQLREAGILNCTRDRETIANDN